MPSANSSLAALPENWQQGGFGIYLHWPFCQSKCPYCDFNSHVAETIDQARWQSAYLSELDRYADETGDRILGTVFFGGGTPSLMSPDLVATVLDRIRANWTLGNDFEVTLEANPGSVEAGRFRGYRDAGVNRISMGVQALNDPDLRALGRLHSVAEARAAFDVARACFDRISFDLIYARQDQTLDAWRTELSEALAMAVDHLSLYQLSIEDGTAFGARHARGLLRGLPDDDLSADMYEVTQEVCAAAGLPAYEISNHARPGAESRHNLIYWRGGDYLGIGPGAHGRIGTGKNRIATETALAPGKWLHQVETTGNGDASRMGIPLVDQATEYLLMGLRLTEGVDIKRLNLLQPEFINPRSLRNLCDLGLAEIDCDTLRVTAKGRPVLNAVLRDLLTD